MPSQITFIVLVVWLQVMSLQVAGQFDSTASRNALPKNYVKAWNVGMHYGSIFAHSQAVQNTAGANPVGVSLAYTFQRRDKGAIDLCNCYPRKGVVASYTNFDNAVLGKGAMLGWMLEPVYDLGKGIQLSVKGIAGAAWLSNPFDSVKNPTNQSYSTALSAWLAVGLGISVPINEHWRTQVAANFEHTSNGGMRQPNKGINMPIFSLQVQYTPNPVPFFVGKRTTQQDWKGAKWQKELSLFATAKRAINANGTSTRKPIAGMQMLVSKQVGHLHALSLGAEAYNDSYTRVRLDEEELTEVSAARVGLMGGHRFLLGKFHFSQQLGWYAFNPSPYDGTWFHRWGVQYALHKNVQVGFNLKAHKHVADFIDVRVGYTW